MLLFGVLAGLQSLSLAQTAITGWSLTSADAANISKYGAHAGGSITFETGDLGISTFVAGGGTFQYNATAGFGGASTYIRRNTDAGDSNNVSVWSLNNNGVATTVDGRYQGATNYVLGNDNLLNGVDEFFANGAGSASSSLSNIERVDFYWSAGVRASNASGITIFDRGLGDNVQIAVFTGWNSSTNRPTTYSGNVVELINTDFTTGGGLDIDPTAAAQYNSLYNIYRFTSGDDLSESSGTMISNTYVGGAQSIVGSFVSFADLGIAAGTVVYGYSIMATDVTNTVANLADWTSATYYPTGTTSTDGGVDLVGFNGYVAVPLPEPSTYGALLVGFSLVGWFCRKKFKART